MQRIRSYDDIIAGLEQLLVIDPELEPLLAITGPLPLRLHEPGFSALARIVIAQLVSQASADAIYGRFKQLIQGETPQSWLAAGEQTIRKIGLTRAKQATLTEVAQALVHGDLDLGRLEELTASQASGELCRIKGIGQWTSEIYLLSCCGHADIFPAGDLALRNAVGRALRLEHNPSQAEVRAIAKRWKPVRGIAARLFWTYYKAVKDDREGGRP